MILILILTKNIDGLLGMHCEGYTCEFKSHCVTTVKKNDATVFYITSYHT